MVGSVRRRWIFEIAAGVALFTAAACARGERRQTTDTSAGAVVPTPTPPATDVPAGALTTPVAGPPHTSPMLPKGGAQLTPDQVKAVAAYVYSISHP